jgi:anti-anti-sigma factor
MATKKKPSKAMGWAELRFVSESFADAQKLRIAVNNRIEAGPVVGLNTQHLKEIGFAEMLEQIESSYAKSMIASFKAVAPDIHAWTLATLGLGEVSMARLLGIIGDPTMAWPHHWEPNTKKLKVRGTVPEKILVADPPYPRNVAKLWAYCGVGDPERRHTKDMDQLREGVGLAVPPGVPGGTRAHGGPPGDTRAACRQAVVQAALPQPRPADRRQGHPAGPVGGRLCCGAVCCGMISPVAAGCPLSADRPDGTARGADLREQRDLYDGAFKAVVITGSNPAVVSLQGELDIAGAKVLQSVLASLEGDVHLLCGDLTFIDGAGIGSLLRAHREITKRGAKLVVYEPTARVLRVLSLVRADEELQIDA